MSTIFWDLPPILPDVPFTIVSEKGTCVELMLDVQEGGVYIAEKTGWKYRYMESLDDGHTWHEGVNWAGFYEVPNGLESNRVYC